MLTKKAFVGVNKARFNDTGQQRHIDSLAKNISILVGQTKNKDDRAVLYRDLQDLGIITSSGQFVGSGAGGGGTTIVVGGGGGGGGVVIPPTEQPTQPQNVTANAAFTTIMIQWDYPTYSGHKHAEIWRNTVDQLGDMLDPRDPSEAALIATTTDNLYVDSVNFDTGYYYWVRFINIDDEAGAVHSASGVYAKTKKDITTYITDVETAFGLEFDAYELAFNTALGLANDAATAADAKAQGALDDISGRINGVLDGLGTSLDDIANDYPTLAFIQTNYYSVEQANLAATSIVTSQISALNITDYSTLAFLQTNYYTRTDTETTVSGMLDTFYSSTITPNFTTTAQMAIDYYTKTEAQAATAGQLTTFQSEVLGVEYKTVAQLTADHYTKAGADFAITAKVDLLKSQIFDPDGTTVSQAFADQVTITSADIEGAVATAVDQYSVTYAGATYSIAQITQVAIDADGTYQTQWGVQTTVGGLNYGIGFLDNNGVTTLAVSADNFGVYNPANGVLELAFAVVDGGIVAKKAIIGEAQLGELLVQYRSIFEGDVLVNSKLTGAFIHGARMSAGEFYLRGVNNVLIFDPDNVYAMWFGSRFAYDPTQEGSADNRSDLSAKFALKHDGTILTRAMTIYNDSNQVILDVNGVDGAYIKDLSVDTLSIAGNAISDSAYTEFSNISIGSFQIATFPDIVFGSTGISSAVAGAVIAHFVFEIKRTSNTGTGGAFATFTAALRETSTNNYLVQESKTTYAPFNETIFVPFALYSDATTVDNLTVETKITSGGESFNLRARVVIKSAKR